MVVVPLELFSRSELIVKGVSYIIKTLKEVLQKRVEPMIDDAFEIKGTPDRGEVLA